MRPDPIPSFRERFAVAWKPPDSSLDESWPNCSFPCAGGLGTHALHEIYAAAPADHVAVSGFALGIARDIARTRTAQPILWVRQDFLDGEAGRVCPAGLVEFGLDPTVLTLVRARDVLGVLQAGLESARCRPLGAVILEFQGRARRYDLTASRRLNLAARNTGVPVLVLRSAAEPVPSAAETRWRVRALPSFPLPAQAPGRPAFEALLLRRRGAGETKGREGMRWALEWNRDAGCFEEAGYVGREREAGNRPGEHGAALPRPVVSIPAHRSDAAIERPASFRKAG